jgi:hypothetical protein
LGHAAPLVTDAWRDAVTLVTEFFAVANGPFALGTGFRRCDGGGAGVREFVQPTLRRSTATNVRYGDET